eukprot:scaffold160960_cov29-Prasinocladus_malaysianus.AAC.3
MPSLRIIDTFNITATNGGRFRGLSSCGMLVARRDAVAIPPGRFSLVCLQGCAASSCSDNPSIT